MSYNMENSRDKEAEKAPVEKTELPEPKESDENADNFDDCKPVAARNVEATETPEEDDYSDCRAANEKADKVINESDGDDDYGDCKAVNEDTDEIVSESDDDDYSDCAKITDSKDLDEEIITDRKTEDDPENQVKNIEQENNVSEKTEDKPAEAEVDEEIPNEAKPEEETPNKVEVEDENPNEAKPEEESSNKVEVEDENPNEAKLEEELPDKVEVEDKSTNNATDEDKAPAESVTDEEKAVESTAENEDQTPELSEDMKVDDEVNEVKEKDDEEPETEELPLDERIDKALEGDGASAEEINGLRDEHAEKLQSKLAEKDEIEEERKKKFDEALSCEKGSEEYKKALGEHNELQDKKAALEEEIESMEEKQEVLNKRSLELREAQLEKGAEVMEKSEATVEKAEELQDRFDETFSEAKTDKSELTSIREENTATVRELSAEKDSLKQAMSAKMDEISEYVIANNMGRYDTARDKHYQEMSAEYLAMKERYDSIRYHIVNLEENSKEITAQLGDTYTPVSEMPSGSKIPEVKNGVDVPGETEYFEDEEKAAEILSPFNQKSWDKLTVSEQKQAVARLADYNAEILGVEDKPKIVYYNVEDPKDFGGYSEKYNVIFINEYNMGDAAETADTISHEYRHKYQHERAEKLENERDLSFKEGFDNYVAPEDDYRRYRDQAVEADARAYADVIKNKISTYAESPSKTVDSGNESDSGSDFKELNPEKGTVFEKVSAEDLPEDFERKYKGPLDAKEITELKEAADLHYENSKKLWSRFDAQELKGFKEHCEIDDGHIEKVRLKSLEAAESLEKHFAKNDYDGIYSPNIDKNAVEIMAIYHDTGMDGGILPEEYEAKKEAFISNEENRKRFVDKYLEKERKLANRFKLPFDPSEVEKTANDEFERVGFEESIRKNHSLESAIHVLKDRKKIEAMGVDADRVALGCFLHSKSNSGCEHLESEKEWADSIDRLKARVAEYNLENPDDRIEFDSSFILGKDGFDKDALASMRSEVLALRIGDSNGHDMNSKTSQGGESIEFTLERRPAKEGLPEDFVKTNGDKYESFFLEVQEAEVKVGGTELNNTNDPKGYARMFAVGEGNFRSMSCTVDEKGELNQSIELCDSDAYPLSTQQCIMERIGEYRSGDPAKCTFVIKLDKCSDETLKSYNEFAKRFKGKKNNVKVKLEVK